MAAELAHVFCGSTNLKRADARTMSKKVVLEEAKPLFLGNVLNVSSGAPGVETQDLFEEVACKVCTQ